MEGSHQVAAVARTNFNDLGLTNIELIEGNFDDQLPKLIQRLPSSIGLCFIDGNHRLQPTIQYFETILTKIYNSSIVVLDDIHWSDEMEQAWIYCKEHSAVSVSIDLFFVGILVFRKEIREKQHFIIRF
jgi:predicted O-methyltransferase YrrM